MITSIQYPAPTALWGTTANEIWTYNNNRPVTSYTDKRGNTSAFTYDSVGNKLTDTKSVTTPGGVQSIVKTWTYNSSSRVISFTDPRGQMTTNSYDVMGRLSSITLPTIAAGTPVENFTYNANSHVSSVSDALNNVLSKTYDMYGNLASITSPMSKVTSYTYDTWGHKLTETSPSGVVRQSIYGDVYYCVAEEVTFDTQGGVSRTEYSYSAGRRITGKKLPNDVFYSLGNTYRYSYDSLNRMIVETDCYGYSKYYEFDASGNRISYAHDVDHNASRITTLWDYDAWNRCYSETDTGNFTASWILDANSNKVSDSDKCGKTATYTYDELNRKISMTDPLNYTRYWEYDANNNETKFTNSLGDFWITTYDNSNRPLREYDPYNSYTANTYDIAGVLPPLYGPVLMRVFVSTDNRFSTPISGEGLSVAKAEARYCAA